MPGISRVAPIFFLLKAIYQASYSLYDHKGRIEMHLQMIDFKMMLPFWASISGEILHSALICKSGEECLATLS